MIRKYEAKPLPMKDFKSEQDDFAYKHVLYHGDPDQRCTGYIIGAQNSGKSTMILNILKLQAHKKKTQIFWISSVSTLDKKVQDFAKNYLFQFYDEKDIENDVL